METPYVLMAAIILDLLLGDPFNRFHPVVWIGNLARSLEAPARRLLKNPFWAGWAVWLCVVGATAGTGWAFLAICGRIHPLLGDLAAIWCVYACLAAKSLQTHIRAVYTALSQGDLDLAREKVGWVVGRDTQNMEASDVARAAVESAAENLVDGVTAPLFWACLGGPLGVLIYKAISTLDSTFGYRNQAYLLFGRVSARMDDAANFLPARLTGPVMVLAAGLTGLNARGCWRIFLRDRLKHASPNAAHGEAAAAGALNVRLGGPSSYGGVVSEKPYLGDPVQTIEASHILEINRLNLVAGLIFAGLFIGPLLYGSLA